MTRVCTNCEEPITAEAALAFRGRCEPCSMSPRLMLTSELLTGLVTVTMDLCGKMDDGVDWHDTSDRLAELQREVDRRWPLVLKPPPARVGPSPDLDASLFVDRKDRT